MGPVKQELEVRPHGYYAKDMKSPGFRITSMVMQSKWAVGAVG